MPPKRPTAVMVIAILQFIFGGLGLLFNVCGGAARLSGADMMFTMAGQQSTLAQDLQKQMEQSAANAPAVKYGSLGLDLVISVLMIISGVGLLQMRSWGRILAILYAILSIALKVFTAVVGVVVALPDVNAFIAQHPARDQQEAIILGGMQIGAIVGVVLPILCMIYPIVVLVIMLRPRIAAAFRGDTAVLLPDEDYRDPGPDDRYYPADS